MAFAAPLLLASLAASATLEYGVRTEVRGGGRTTAGAPEQTLALAVDPSVALEAAPSRELTLGLGYAPGLLVLNQAAGAADVGTTTLSHAGRGSARWQPTATLQLSLAGAASLGTLQASTLSQLATAGDAGTTGPPQPGQVTPSPAPVDPLSRSGTGRYRSAEIHLGAGWTPRRDLALGATAGVASTGGVGTPARSLFPPRLVVGAGASATWTPTARDDLGLLASYDDNRLTGAGAGSVRLLGVSARWDHRLTPADRAWVSAGATDTLLDDTGVALDSPFGRVAPQAEAGYTTATPEGQPGHRLTALLSFAPYIDPYANQRTQRLTVRGTFEWRPADALGLSASLLAAQAVGDGRLGAAGLAGELGAGIREGGWDLGAGVRAGLQRDPRPVVVNRDWGFFATVAWRGTSRL